jgi:small subunit ribosomal protein S20
MAEQKKDKTKKTKRPTAAKRMLQSEKGRTANRQFKSQVRTAMRRFEEMLATKDEASVKDALNNVYSLMDKGVKRGTFKLNKSSRTKSRLTARVAAAMVK